MRHAGRAKALVASWLDFLPPLLKAPADALRRQVQTAAPELAEAIKWGNLVFTLDGQPVLGLAPAKNHLNLQLLQGAAWPAPLLAVQPALRGAHHWRLDPGQTIDPVLLEMVLAAAITHARERAAERPPRLPDA